ncbi:TonB-dependent siderophore receptor [Sinomicrobium soli]|nr:TonB-dependent siderophore receptor [Sinomicrobium sp. N-1-3-6]
MVFLSFNAMQAQEQGVLLTPVTLQEKAMTLPEALKTIGERAGVHISYNSSLINTGRKVAPDFDRVPLGEVLQQLLGDRLADISVRDKNVTLRLSRGKGIVRGQVLTRDGSPVPYVSVVIEKSGFGAVTDEAGNFSLKAPEGTRVLTTHFIGLKQQQQQVALSVDRPVEVVFTLEENAEELKEVIVQGQRQNKFAVKQSENVAKMPLRNLENPQVYSSIPVELFTEQINTQFSDILKNSPGVYKISEHRGINTGGGTFYTIRGFLTTATVVDGMLGQTNAEFETANVEKVEVMKGPSGTLYGGGGQTLGGVSFGGLINIVTKKPLDTLGGEVSYTAGSYNLNRVTADLYGPLNKKKDLLFRLNTAFQDQNTFQDAGFRRSFFIAPVLQYRPDERLDIKLDASFYNSKSTSPPVTYLPRNRPFIATTPDELGFDWTRSYTNDDIYIKNPTVNVRGRVDYRISDEWKSQTIIAYNDRQSDGLYQYQFMRGDTDDLLERNFSKQNTSNKSFEVQQNFTGDFKVAGLRNRIVAGLDYLNQTIDNNNSPYLVLDTVNAIMAGKQPGEGYYNIRASALEDMIGAVGPEYRTVNHSNNNIYSAYASDVLNITDDLMAMLSLRVDHFDNGGTYNKITDTLVANSKFSQTAVSPKFGLVYNVVKDKVSLFGNYMNGFANVSPVTQPLPDISGSFKPQRANQAEGGVKMDLFDRRLSLTASYYYIEVDNMTYKETIEREGQSYNITVQDGTQRSSGVDLEIIANPVDGLNIVAGYSYNDSKYVQSIPALLHRRPNYSGPKNMVNAWISYVQPVGRLKGLGAGFGGNYMSENFAANTSATGIFRLPAFTLLNATVFYEMSRFRIGVKADNLLNERYFYGQGVITPQLRRNYAANITFRF